MYELVLPEESTSFEIQDNNLFYNRKLLISWLDGAKINLSARKAIVNDVDVKLFDRILFGLVGAGVQYDYVSDSATLYNYTARYDSFVNGKETPTEAMVEAVAKELNIPGAFVSLAPKILDTVKKYMKDNYSIPKFKYPVGEINFEKMFGNLSAQVETWLNSNTSPSYEVIVKARQVPSTHNLLRVRVTSTRTYIESLMGEKFTVGVAERVYRHCASYWNGDGISRYKTIGNYQLTVQDNYITYGCQSTSRSEIERIARQMGWA